MKGHYVNPSTACPGFPNLVSTLDYAGCLCGLAPGGAGVEGERRDSLSEDARSVMRLPQSCRRAGPPTREEAGEPDARVPILGERRRGDCRYRTRAEDQQETIRVATVGWHRREPRSGVAGAMAA